MINILITGANRGVGLALVKEYLLVDGYTLIATCRTPRNATALQELQQEYPNRVRIFPMDVTNDHSIDNVTSAVDAEFDHIDYLINNAGINPSPSSIQSFENITADMMTHVLHVNAIAPLMVVKAFYPLLKKSSTAKVMNVSSQMGAMTWHTSGGHYAYTTSKAALNMVTRALAGDLIRDDITTITVHPGWVQTDMGGKSASLTPKQSASGLVNLLDKIQPEDNGKFFRWDGSEHPW